MINIDAKQYKGRKIGNKRCKLESPNHSPNHDVTKEKLKEKLCAYIMETLKEGPNSLN